MARLSEIKASRCRSASGDPVELVTDCLPTSCSSANKSLRDKAQERRWSGALRCRDRSSHTGSSAVRLQRRRLKNSSSRIMWRGLNRTCPSPCFYSKFHFIHVHLSGAGNAHLNDSEIVAEKVAPPANRNVLLVTLERPPLVCTFQLLLKAPKVKEFP